MSDFVGATKRGLTQISGSFGAEIQGTIRTTTGLLEQFVSGGIYGIAGAVATLAVNGLVQWLSNVAEAARKHREQMDAMRNGYWSLIDAQLAAKAAQEQSALDAIVDKAQSATKAVDALVASMNGLANAEDSVMGAEFNLKIAQINEEFSQQLAEACSELKPLISAEKNLATAVAAQEAARKQQQRAIERETDKLNDCAIKIEHQQQVIAAQIAAGQDTTEAERKLANLKIEHATQTERLKAAEKNSEAKLLQHETAVREATLAVENAKSGWEATVEANENEIEALNEKERQEREIAKIIETCAKNQVDANEYIQLWTECIKNGMTETEAYGELQKKLNEELKKRREAEEKANEEAKKKAEDEAEGKKGKKGKKDGTSSIATITFDPSRVSEGVKEWDGQTTYSKTRQDISNNTKTAAQEQKRINGEVKNVVELMKGNLPPEIAKAYVNQLMKDYSPEQLQTLQEKALGKQLLSKEDQKKQLEYLGDVAEAAKKMGLK